MFGKKDIPVYLFTGFLESGKTTCIQDVIDEGNFSDGSKTLYLSCEEGAKAIDDQVLMANRMSFATWDEEQSLTEDVCTKLEKKYKPDRVVIEYNGLWDIKRLTDEVLPEHWFVVQTFTTVNASTYQLYSQNFRAWLTAHFQNADLVIFNRCQEGFDKPAARRSVKAINRMAQVLFEAEDGSVITDINEELPYDIHQDTIELEDDDYGLWYLDITEHPEKYEGKTMVFKGQVFRKPGFPPRSFVPVRKAMTCCVEDIAPIGFMCFSNDESKYKTNSWVRVTAKVELRKVPNEPRYYPVLCATSLQEDQPPKEEVVYFT